MVCDFVYVLDVVYYVLTRVLLSVSQFKNGTR